jgi:hypothetical protein
MADEAVEYRQCTRCALFVRGASEEPRAHPCGHRDVCAVGCVECKAAREAERVERARR